MAKKKNATLRELTCDNFPLVLRCMSKSDPIAQAERPQRQQQQRTRETTTMQTATTTTTTTATTVGEIRQRQWALLDTWERVFLPAYPATAMPVANKDNLLNDIFRAENGLTRSMDAAEERSDERVLVQWLTLQHAITVRPEGCNCNRR